MNTSLDLLIGKYTMTKRELEQLILKWSFNKIQNSQWNISTVAVQRLYQTGVLVGLIASLAEDDFYLKSRLKKLLLDQKT